MRSHRPKYRPAAVADKSDAHEVGRAGRAERHAGDDDDALAGFGETFLEGKPAGALHHVVLIVRILGDDGVDAPDDGQFASGVFASAKSQRSGICGRSRETRKPVEPDAGPAHDRRKVERFGHLPRRRRDGVGAGGSGSVCSTCSDGR